MNVQLAYQDIACDAMFPWSQAMDEDRKVAKLQEIAKLEQEELARRAVQPIKVSEALKQASEPVDLGSDDEEEDGEEEEQVQPEQKAAPSRRPRRAAAGRRTLRIKPSS